MSFITKEPSVDTFCKLVCLRNCTKNVRSAWPAWKSNGPVFWAGRYFAHCGLRDHAELKRAWHHGQPILPSSVVMERYRHQMAPWKYLKFEFPAKNFQKSVMWKFIFFSVFISKFGGSHLFYPNSEPRRVQNGKLWPTALSHRCQDQYLLEGLCM